MRLTITQGWSNIANWKLGRGREEMRKGLPDLRNKEVQSLVPRSQTEAEVSNKINLQKQANSPKMVKPRKDMDESRMSSKG